MATYLHTTKQRGTNAKGVYEMRPRDTERTKVYRAGWNMQDRVEGAALLCNTSQEAQAITLAIWEATGAKAPCPRVRIDRRRKNRSTSHGGLITLAPRMATLHVLTHELAHELLRAELPTIWANSASHGVEFRTAWMEVLAALGSIEGGKLFQEAHNMSTALRSEFISAGLERKCEETCNALRRLRFNATGGTQLPEAPSVEPTPNRIETPNMHTAKAELERRAANRKAKRNGGVKIPFPKGANPALFKASATELRAMA